MNLKFSFFIPSLLTKGTKLKISFFLSRGIYTHFLTIETRHLFRLLPSTFHSFFFFSLSFTFFISPSNFFFPYPVIIFLSRTKISPLSLTTNSNCARGKHREICFQAFLHIFGQFYIFHISLERWDGKNSRSGEGESERSTAILNRTAPVSVYF